MAPPALYGWHNDIIVDCKVKQVTQEDHFEKSLEPGASTHAAPEGFNGRKPWGLDAKGADVGDDPWAFDHGIRRSPAEGRDFEGAAVRRSPAEELVSKGYFLPYAKRRCEGEELRCGAYRYRLREDGTARLVSYEGSAEQVDIPAEVDGARVASLATNLFRGHAEPRCVSMPDTVEFAATTCSTAARTWRACACRRRSSRWTPPCSSGAGRLPRWSSPCPWCGSRETRFLMRR